MPNILQPEYPRSPYQIITTATPQELRDWAAFANPSPTQKLSRLALGIEPVALSPPMIREVGVELDEDSKVPASLGACNLVARAIGEPIGSGELTVASFFEAAQAMLPPKDTVTLRQSRVLLWAAGVPVFALEKAVIGGLKEGYIRSAGFHLVQSVRQDEERLRNLRNLTTELINRANLSPPDPSDINPGRLNHLLTHLFKGTYMQNTVVNKTPVEQQLAILNELFQRHRSRPLEGRGVHDQVGGIRRLWQYCMGFSAQAILAAEGLKSKDGLKYSMNLLAGYLRVDSKEDLEAIRLFLKGSAEKIVLGNPGAFRASQANRSALPHLLWKTDN